MAAIDERIEVYKWNKTRYDEPSLYTTAAGVNFSQLQGYYGWGYSGAYTVEVKFKVTNLTVACTVIRSDDNHLAFGTVIVGGQPYWQLSYYNGSSTQTYTTSFNADFDNHIFKITVDGKYYLDSTLLVDEKYWQMTAYFINVFNSSIMKLFWLKYEHFPIVSYDGSQHIAIYSQSPDFTMRYDPYLNGATPCLIMRRTDRSTETIKFKDAGGTLYGEFNSETLELVAELDNNNFESVKSVESFSALGDELVYDTLDVIAKEEVSSTSSNNK